MATRDGIQLGKLCLASPDRIEDKLEIYNCTPWRYRTYCANGSQTSGTDLCNVWYGDRGGIGPCELQEFANELEIMHNKMNHMVAAWCSG